MLVDKFSSKHLDLSDYSDTYAQELEKLIEAKAKGKPIIVRSEPQQKATPDLLDALKASIEVKKLDDSTSSSDRIVDIVGSIVLGWTGR